jgi:hypothetical protein
VGLRLTPPSRPPPLGRRAPPPWVVDGSNLAILCLCLSNLSNNNNSHFVLSLKAKPIIYNNISHIEEVLGLWTLSLLMLTSPPRGGRWGLPNPWPPPPTPRRWSQGWKITHKPPRAREDRLRRFPSPSKPPP